MKKIALVLIALIAFTACSKTQEIKIIEPPRQIILNVIQSIDGDLGKYVYAKNEKIKISFEKDDDEMYPGIKYEVPVKVIFSKISDIKSGQGYNNYGPHMKIEFLDTDGKIIDNLYAGMKISYKDLSSYIQAGNNREEWVIFSGQYSVSSINQEKSFEESKAFINSFSKASYVRIKSEIITEKFEEKSEHNTSQSESSYSENTNMSKCDKVLKNYEEFMIEYVDFVIKYADNPTDATLISKYSQMMIKYSEWPSKIGNCADDPNFMGKFSEVQLKIANAMQ